jgi:hypothetical protein
MRRYLKKLVRDNPGVEPFDGPVEPTEPHAYDWNDRLGIRWVEGQTELWSSSQARAALLKRLMACY